MNTGKPVKSLIHFPPMSLIITNMSGILNPCGLRQLPGLLLHKMNFNPWNIAPLGTNDLAGKIVFINFSGEIIIDFAEEKLQIPKENWKEP